MGVMHEADDTYTQSGASGRVIGWTDFSLNTWMLSKFSIFHWICLLFILLILVGVELPLCIFVTLSCNAITCFLESS